MAQTSRQVYGLFVWVKLAAEYEVKQTWLMLRGGMSDNNVVATHVREP